MSRTNSAKWRAGAHAFSILFLLCTIYTVYWCVTDIHHISNGKSLKPEAVFLLELNLKLGSAALQSYALIPLSVSQWGETNNWIDNVCLQLGVR